jgi:hypothetical protein
MRRSSRCPACFGADRGGYVCGFRRCRPGPGVFSPTASAPTASTSWAPPFALAGVALIMCAPRRPERAARRAPSRHCIWPRACRIGGCWTRSGSAGQARMDSRRCLSAPSAQFQPDRFPAGNFPAGTTGRPSDNERPVRLLTVSVTGGGHKAGHRPGTANECGRTGEIPSTVSAGESSSRSMPWRNCSVHPSPTRPDRQAGNEPGTGTERPLDSTFVMADPPCHGRSSQPATPEPAIGDSAPLQGIDLTGVVVCRSVTAHQSSIASMPSCMRRSRLSFIA